MRRVCSLTCWGSVFICALALSQAASVTWQGDLMPCSLLLNSATAVKDKDGMDGVSSPSQALIDLVGIFGQATEQVTHYPVTAVLGGDSLFTSERNTAQHVNLSPAIEVGGEVCFLAMPDNRIDKLDASCRPVCTKLQESEVSISYHETDLGTLPFLFIGESAQEAAACQEIVYPDYRTAMGWMCKHQHRKVAAPAQSGAARQGFAAVWVVLLVIVASLLFA